MPPKASVAQRADAAGVSPASHVGTWFDDCVGAVLGTLDELGLADDTVFIFASDHQSRGKFTCYEGARAPMIVRWPGRIAPGTVNDTLSANVDLPTTLIEIAGGTPPADMAADGRSLLQAWTTGRAPQGWREALLLECSSVRAVVTDRWSPMSADRDNPSGNAHGGSRHPEQQSRHRRCAHITLPIERAVTDDHERFRKNLPGRMTVDKKERPNDPVEVARGTGDGRVGGQPEYRERCGLEMAHLVQKGQGSRLGLPYTFE